MKCSICGEQIKDYGNNPYPICEKDDTESRCCNICNDLVIRARLLSMKGNSDTIKEGDTVVIFYSSKSDNPIKCFKDSGKFLAGEVTNKSNSNPDCWEGTWGNFLLDVKKDSFCAIP